MAILLILIFQNHHVMTDHDLAAPADRKLGVCAAVIAAIITAKP
jgi:hypothetical protein